MRVSGGRTRAFSKSAHCRAASAARSVAGASGGASRPRAGPQLRRSSSTAERSKRALRKLSLATQRKSGGAVSRFPVRRRVRAFRPPSAGAKVLWSRRAATRGGCPALESKVRVGRGSGQKWPKPTRARSTRRVTVSSRVRVTAPVLSQRAPSPERHPEEELMPGLRSVYGAVRESPPPPCWPGKSWQRAAGP